MWPQDLERFSIDMPKDNIPLTEGSDEISTEHEFTYDPNVITLDSYEAYWAVSVGFYRQEESVRRGRRQSDLGESTTAGANHMRGAAAELALSKFLDVPWNATVNTFNKFPDLDGQLEVRGKPEHEGYMRLSERKDTRKPHHLFICVSRLGDQRFRVEGWMRGQDAMGVQYFVGEDRRSHQPEWHVPVADLLSPDSLRKEVQRRMRAFKGARTRFDAEIKKISQLSG